VTDVTLSIEALVTVRVASNNNAEAISQAKAELAANPNGRPLEVLAVVPHMIAHVEGE
jgi:hypothetical protein